jgi:trimethylamine:corrinoid methyltransferase-like protein
MCFEQLLLDVEVFRQCRRLHQGIGTDRGFWLEEVIAAVGPGGNFLAHPSTRQAVHSGEWYSSELGRRKLPGQSKPAGEHSLLEEMHACIDQILEERLPMPLEDDVEEELSCIQDRARLSE